MDHARNDMHYDRDCQKPPEVRVIFIKGFMRITIQMALGYKEAKNDGKGPARRKYHKQK